jgi:hypothetical protein
VFSFVCAAVAEQDSLLDFGTYMQIMQTSKLPCELFDGSTLGFVGRAKCSRDVNLSPLQSTLRKQISRSICDFTRYNVNKNNNYLTINMQLYTLQTNLGGCITCPEKALVVDAPRIFFRDLLKDELKVNAHVRRVTQVQDRDADGTVGYVPPFINACVL